MVERVPFMYTDFIESRYGITYRELDTLSNYVLLLSIDM